MFIHDTKYEHGNLTHDINELLWDVTCQWYDLVNYMHNIFNDWYIVDMVMNMETWEINRIRCYNVCMIQSKLLMILSLTVIGMYTIINEPYPNIFISYVYVIPWTQRWGEVIW